MKPFDTTRLCLTLLLLLSPSVGCSRFQKRSTVAELERARQLSFQGFEHGQEGQWEQAEGFYRQAVEVCPQDERARALLADALWNNQQLAPAIDQQRQAVVRSGGDPRQHVRLGEMLLKVGRWEEALGQAEVAIEKSRQSTGAWNLKGNVLLAKSQYQEALSCFHRSLAFDAQQREVHERVALIYEVSGRPQRALATWYALEEMFSQDEIPASVLYREALALRRLDRDTQALDRLLDARARDPQSPEIVVALADLQWTLGDRDNARLTLLSGEKAWPSNPEIQRLAQRWRPTPTADGVLR